MESLLVVEISDSLGPGGEPNQGSDAASSGRPELAVFQ
jgi:hypothetical protein